MAKFTRETGDVKFVQGPSGGVVDTSTAKFIKQAGQVAFNVHANKQEAGLKEGIENVLEQREASEVMQRELDFARQAASQELNIFESTTGGEDESFFNDPALQEARKNYKKLKNAQVQGRLDARSARQRIDMITKQYVDRYPYLRRELLSIAEETTGVSGFGSLYARLLLTDPQTEKTEKPFDEKLIEASAMSAFKAGFGVFDEKGRPDVGGSIAKHQDYVMAEQRLQQLQAQKSVLASQGTITAAQTKRIDADIKHSVLSQVNAITSPLLSSLNTIRTQATGAALTPTTIAKIDTLRSALSGSRGQIEQSIRQKLIDARVEDVSGTLTDIMATSVDPLLDIFTDEDNSIFLQNRDALQLLEDKLGMSAIQAAPFISALRQSGGGQVVANMVNLYSFTVPEIKQKLEENVRGLLSVQEAEKLNLSNFIDLTEGKKSINEMDREQQQGVFAKSVSYLNAENSVDKMTPPGMSRWARTAAGGWSFVNGASSGDSSKLIDISAHPNFMKHLGDLKKADPFLFETLSDTMNSKYPTMLETLERELRAENLTKINTVIYNSNTGKFEIGIDEAAAKAEEEKFSRKPKRSRGNISRIRAIDSAARVKVDKMNKILMLATITGQTDVVGSMFEGKSMKQFVAQTFTTVEQRGPDLLGDKFEEAQRMLSESGVSTTTLDKEIDKATAAAKSIQQKALGE